MASLALLSGERRQCCTRGCEGTSRRQRVWGWRKCCLRWPAHPFRTAPPPPAHTFDNNVLLQYWRAATAGEASAGTKRCAVPCAARFGTVTARHAGRGWRKQTPRARRPSGVCARGGAGRWASRAAAAHQQQEAVAGAVTRARPDAHQGACTHPATAGTLRMRAADTPAHHVDQPSSGGQGTGGSRRGAARAGTAALQPSTYQLHATTGTLGPCTAPPPLTRVHASPTLHHAPWFSCSNRLPAARNWGVCPAGALTAACPLGDHHRHHHPRTRHHFATGANVASYCCCCCCGSKRTHTIAKFLCRAPNATILRGSDWAQACTQYQVQRVAGCLPNT
jgi:hypothetical protein